MFEKGIFRMFIFLGAIRVSKNAHPMFLRCSDGLYGGRTSINACFRVFWVCGSWRDGL